MSTSPWIRSLAWDSFWMLSGFWIPTLFLCLPLDSAKPLILLITLCFWIGHRVSSMYLAFCVGEYREVLAARKGYFFLLPACLFVLLMGFLLCPESLLPIPRLERVILLALVDYFFSLYHFSVQHYGVLSVYRGKLAHGQQHPGLLKWDWWICIGVSGLFSIFMDLVNGELDALYPFGAGSLLQLTGEPVLWLKLGLSGLILLFWGLTLRLYHRRNQGIARVLYFSTLCYMTLVSIYVEPLIYFAIVQIQHWLVSLGLITHMAANSRFASPGQRWYRPWAWVNARAFGPLLVLVLLSVCLTPVLEADYYISQGFNPESLTVQHFLAAFKDSIWIYLFGGLAFFSSALHYIYDRGVFRFSHPLTRKVALGLLKPPPAP